MRANILAATSPPPELLTCFNLCFFSRRAPVPLVGEALEGSLILESMIQLKIRSAPKWLIPSVLIGSFALQAPAAPEPEVAALLENHCVNCHDGGLKRGGLNLEAILGEGVGAHRGIWENVIRRLGARQMPPPDEERPPEEVYQETVAALETYLDGLSARDPEPGNVPAIRRLTRTEYGNAIRDLLGPEVGVSEMLPPDESSHGFDNITVGSLSPTLLSRYIHAAQKIARLAVGGGKGKPEVRVVRVPADWTQEERVEGLPPGTRGGVLTDHLFPTAGEYEIEVRLARDRNEEIEGLSEPHQIEMLLDGERVAEFEVKPPGSPDFSKVDAHLKTRIAVEAGQRKVGVTFVRKGSSLLESRRQPYRAQFNMHRHPRQAPAVYQVTISGPHEVRPGGDGPSRKRIFVRMPESADDEKACAEEILRPLLRKAYRRPVVAEDLEGPMEFYRAGREDGGFEDGIEMALTAILVSPRFLLRVEEDPPGLPAGEVYRLDDVALASRLSFFLWASIPDEELLDVAERRGLSQPEMLERQVRRMLADPKSAALVTNFADQWLHLRNVEALSPDARLFPDFDDNLRHAFRRETELFFASVLEADGGVMDLLKADYTFLNERLAKHYGIPHVYGSRFRRVDLGEGSRRGGLLRHASILSVTSYAHRTSPVIRGNWILENVLGTPTPPPPPDIPALEDAVVSEDLPMRARLAAHREDRSCATCHNLMDPVGFSLENYDAVGRWREREGDAPVDSSGGLPDGQAFSGADGLEKGLLKRPDLFARTVTEKLLTYALGRGLEAHDAPSVRRILRDSAAAQYRFSDIILGIARSVPFTHRKTP